MGHFQIFGACGTIHAFCFSYTCGPPSRFQLLQVACYVFRRDFAALAVSAVFVRKPARPPASPPSSQLPQLFFVVCTVCRNEVLAAPFLTRCVCLPCRCPARASCDNGRVLQRTPTFEPGKVVARKPPLPPARGHLPQRTPTFWPEKVVVRKSTIF